MAEEKYSKELLEKWNNLQILIDEIEPTFNTLLRKSISKSTDISKTKYIIHKKTFESTVEKFKRKSRSIETFSDLLRAVILVGSKVNLWSIVNGLKYYFDLVKVDVKEQTRESSYGNAIHVDVLCEGVVCEVQIMSRQTYTYKQMADKIYKSDLSEEDKKRLQKKWFNRGVFMEDAVRKAYNLSNKLYDIVKKADADEATTKALISLLHDTAKEVDIADSSYIVGGAVRDYVLGVFPKDIDIAVETTTDNGVVKNAVTLSKAIAEKIGIPDDQIFADTYGVVHIGPIPNNFYYDDVNLKGQKIEIVTARNEAYDKSKDKKSYKPTSVQPGTIIDDLERRDFTFNTLMWRIGDLGNGMENAPVLDLLGTGLEDLRNGVVRTPKDPYETFHDDATRMLRGVRFAAKYNATIDDETKKAIKEKAETIKEMPWEPVGDVLVYKIIGKLSKEQIENAFRLMEELGLLKPVLEHVNRAFLINQVGDILGNNADMLMTINGWLDKYNVAPILPKIKPEFYNRLKELHSSLPKQQFQEMFQKLKTNLVDTRVLMQNGITGPNLGKAIVEAKNMLLNNPNISQEEIMANLLDI